MAHRPIDPRLAMNIHFMSTSQASGHHPLHSVAVPDPTEMFTAVMNIMEGEVDQKLYGKFHTPAKRNMKNIENALQENSSGRIGPSPSVKKRNRSTGPPKPRPVSNKSHGDGEGVMAKIRGKLRRVRFKPEWLEDDEFRGWLQPHPENPTKCMCSVCNTVLTCEKSDLKRHARGPKHQKRITNPKSGSSTKPIDKSTARKETELRLATFFGEHNMNVSTAEDFLSTVRIAFPDSRIARKLTPKPLEYAEMLRDVVKKVETSETLENIKRAEFSIFVDEIVDDMLEGYLCVVVRYVSGVTGFLKTELLDLIPLGTEGVYADSFEKFRDYLSLHGVPIENVVGIACDSDSPLMSTGNFVSKLHERIPGLLLMQNLPYSPLLVGSKACEKLPREPEHLLQSIATYVSADSRRSADFCALQEFLQSEHKKANKITYVRWLAIYTCIICILENWSFLLQMFENLVVIDKVKTAEYILKELKNPFTKAYYLFLKHSLLYFNTYTICLESRGNSGIGNLFESYANLFSTLCQNFLTHNALAHANINVSIRENVLPLGNVYLGTECEYFLNGLPRNEVNQIKLKCLEFYIVFATELQKRILPNNAVFAEMKFLNPTMAFNMNNRDILCRNLYNLSQYFGNFVNANTLLDEWNSLPLYLSQDQKTYLAGMDLDIMWNEISKAIDFAECPQFANLGKLAKLTMSLPHTSEEVNQIFSFVADGRSRRDGRICGNIQNSLAIMKTNFKNRNVDCATFEMTSYHVASSIETVVPDNAAVVT